MNYLKVIFFYLVVSISFFNCENEVENNSNNNLDPSNSYQESNISYGNDSKQTFDLYLAANRSLNTKTIILVHGGGWSGGDKVDMNPYKDIIKQDLPNLAIVNIN